MYYNINDKNIYYDLPITAYNSNRSLVQNLYLEDIITKADCGYYSIRNDSPAQPNNTTEDIENRTINLDKPYVDIIREWIPITE